MPYGGEGRCQANDVDDPYDRILSLGIRFIEHCGYPPLSIRLPLAFAQQLAESQHVRLPNGTLDPIFELEHQGIAGMQVILADDGETQIALS